MHSRYSSNPLVLWPWGYEVENQVSNWEEHQDVSKLFTNAVVRAGNENEWIAGNSAETIYPASGNSHDFAKAYGKSQLAITVELPPGPNSETRTGFEYPQEKIESLAKEIFMGYLAMGEYVGDTYYNYGNFHD